MVLVDRPPGPRGHLLAGNLVAYERDRLDFLSRTRDEYGDFVGFDARTTVIHDLVAVDMVLKDQTGSFVARDNFLQQRFDVAQATAARESMQLLRPDFRRHAVNGWTAKIELLADQALQRMSSVHDFIDPMPDLERFTGQLMCELYFGGGGCTHAQQNLVLVRRQVGRLLDAMSKVIGNPFVLPGQKLSGARRRIQHEYADLLALLQPLLELRAQRSTEPPDLASRLLARWPEPPTNQRVRNDVGHRIIGALLAGYRVPAAAIAWSLMLLADFPARLTQSSRRSDGGQGAAAASHAEVRALCQEALRLYPPTWMMTRQTTQSVRLGPFTLPAGHNVIISPWVLHRRPEDYTEPRDFRPQRWLEEAKTPFSYMPFGRGLGACPGSELSQTVLEIFVRRTIDRFKVVRDQASTIAPDPRTTLLPRGLRVRLTTLPAA